MLLSLIYSKRNDNVKEVISNTILKSELNFNRENLINYALKNKIRFLYSIDSGMYLWNHIHI